MCPGPGLHLKHSLWGSGEGLPSHPPGRAAAWTGDPMDPLWSEWGVCTPCGTSALGLNPILSRRLFCGEVGNVKDRATIQSGCVKR